MNKRHALRNCWHVRCCSWSLLTDALCAMGMHSSCRSRPPARHFCLCVGRRNNLYDAAPTPAGRAP
eukprot:7062195-Alexandrium_andersonii.AAC.1